MSAIASPLVSAAYQAVQQGPANGGKVAGGDKGGFAAMLEDAARSAVETMNNSEKTTMKAAPTIAPTSEERPPRITPTSNDNDNVRPNNAGPT